MASIFDQLMSMFKGGQPAYSNNGMEDIAGTYGRGMSQGGGSSFGAMAPSFEGLSPTQTGLTYPGAEALGSGDGSVAPIPGLDNGFGTGFGWNVGTGLTALGGLSALSNLYGANKAQKLASEQFKFTKNIANTNLNNQIKSYNTSLADRLNARGAMQGDSAAATQAEIEKNRLSR